MRCSFNRIWGCRAGLAPAMRKTRGHLSHTNESARVPAKSVSPCATALISAVLLATVATSAAQLPSSGKRYPRLIVRNAIIIEGNGTPASGPKDIDDDGVSYDEP